MRTLGSLTACVELGKYNVINLIVVDVEKQFGLLGSDIVIHVEMVSVHTTNTIECFEAYEAKIKIMENAIPIFCKSTNTT